MNETYTFYGSRGSGAAAIEVALETCGLPYRWAGTRAHLRDNRPSFLNTLESIEAHDLVAPVFKRHWDA